VLLRDGSAQSLLDYNMQPAGLRQAFPFNLFSTTVGVPGSRFDRLRGGVALFR